MVDKQNGTRIDGITRFQILEMNPLIAFFVLACLISWAVWTPLVVVSYGIYMPTLPYHHFWGALGPILAAIIVSLIHSGKAGLWDLLNRIVQYRVDIHWYLVAILGPFALFTLAGAISRGMGGEGVDLSAFGKSEEFPGFGLMSVWLIHTISFGIGEETGWRGFALPRLQREHSAFSATIILCLFWALWHLPTFFYRPGYSGMDVVGAIGWFFSIMTGAILLTWVFNSTKGSVLIASLFHGSIDVAFTSEDVGPEIMNTMGALVMLWAVAVLFITKPANLSLAGKVIAKA